MAWGSSVPLRHVNSTTQLGAFCLVVSHTMGSAMSAPAMTPKTRMELISALLGFGLSCATAYVILDQLLKRLDPTNSSKKKSEAVVRILVPGVLLYKLK